MVLVALFTASVATLYVINVLFFAFLTASSFNVPQLTQIFQKDLFRKHLLTHDVYNSFTVELSLHIALLKVFAVQIVKLLGGFNYALCRLLYYVDILTIIGLLIHFNEMLKEKEVAETTIKLINKKNINRLQSFISFEVFKNYINPFWKPSDIVIHPNITYATNEEIKEALEMSKQDFDQPRKLMLNVISKNPKATGLRPVLFHIHGGAWKVGTKDHFYPYQKLLVSEDNWIIVNIDYRLAPKIAYPVHLIDIKRAIRWTKQNIASFGGDPDFIIAAGDSAGGHLSAIAAMTANEPRYQPGFEDVDTSFRAVVSINGALDLFHDKNTTSYFSKVIAKHPEINIDFIEQNSPASLVKKTNTLVPFLCLAGERDNIITINEAINFKHNFDERRQYTCTLAVSPAGHHISYIFWSPRALYSGRIIQAWCKKLHEDK